MEQRLHAKCIRGPQKGTLIPPFRLAIIEEGLYRGAYPQKRNLQFLKRLKLKTIISLLPGEPSDDLKGFCKQHNITHLPFAVGKMKDEVTVSPALVAQILETCISPQNLPLFIHCLDGANITGIVVMCLRKLQNWNLSVSTTEFTRFTRGHSIMSVESEFVEMFRSEIKIPLDIPNWYHLAFELFLRELVLGTLGEASGDRQKRHPTLKLKLTKSPEEEAKKPAEPSTPKRKSKPKRKLDTSDSDSEPEPDILQKGMESMRVSRDVEALDLELKGWEKAQTNKENQS
ncbi:Putative tyrosine phosphatase family protein [Acanthamoeba castellanii str. Neff]|uniref:Putative tyrosine phosphatase family protein n=1 Tax=Acanthamoeba castellanii (strain ATCC 30010 / Neff) TaxID=1257118 RepID=L8GV35_ACACF|nr:Putative tyrosine phosphatase family protein [Acanthamoeba castellanii str. Neff]ELR17049.1 Putative tyrosine phosphatase family protein [Acanthamoeba castellanii str. Neff]